MLKKIEDYSISNRAEFEALVKKNLAMQQTDKTKKQQKRIPQITTRLGQIDKVLNKLYEDNALGTIPQDRYEQMSQKYSEEYYALKTELSTLQEKLSAYENAGGRAQKFLKLTERHAAFTDLTPAILNEFISRIEVHERDQKRARYAIQHISIYFNYIGKFENEVTQLAEPTEQEIWQMREEIEETQKEKSRKMRKFSDNIRPNDTFFVWGFYLKIPVFPKSRAEENTRKMPLLRNRGMERSLYENRAYQTGKDHRYMV